MSDLYDVIIIGGGPAGLTAALYNARARLNVLLLEKQKLGGQITITHEIANYPGSVIGGEAEPTGQELMDRMIQQAKEYGAELQTGQTVNSVKLDGNVKKVTTKEGAEFETRSIIIANGAVPRKIGCPGEEELSGKGVSYCATCDGAFFEDMEVYVVGGGNSAVEEATFLASMARKVTIIQNLDRLTATAIAIEQMEKCDNIEVIYNTVVKEIEGDGLVEAMTIENVETKEQSKITADEEDGTFGIFVFIGYLPESELYKGLVDIDEWGYIESDAEMHTNLPGVFVAGDVRPKQLRQVITAAGDGATAAYSAQKYVEQNK